MTYMIKAPEKPCTVDITSRGNITQHLRDLINIGPMLTMDVQTEITKFLRKAQEAGWAPEILNNILECACNYTIYEKDLPSRLPEKGNYWKYNWIQKVSKSYGKDSPFKTKGAFV